jgi:hypothetical protein
MPMYANAAGSILCCPSGKIARTCYCVKPPIIGLSGTLTYEFVFGNTIAKSLNARVENIGPVGCSDLNWARSVAGDLSGAFTALPATGTLVQGADADIAVAMNPTGIPAGTYTGSLDVSESIISGVTPATLPIAITVLPYYTLAINYQLIRLYNSDTYNSTANHSTPVGARQWHGHTAGPGASVGFYLNVPNDYSSPTIWVTNSIGTPSTPQVVTVVFNSLGIPTGTADHPVSWSGGELYRLTWGIP